MATHSSTAAAAKSLQSCPTLCDPIDGSPPGSPVPGILQARTLEWAAISSSNVWKWKVKVKSLSHLTLGDSMDCSLPGSSVHGIFQARVLEWGAITFSIRSTNQGKLEVVKQEMARVNIDILGISKLKWTGMGELNSDDHHIYYCGQESLRSNGVALIVNKRVQNAVLGCSV